MLVKKPQSEPWREALKFMNKCPICGFDHGSSSAKVFNKEKNANLVHITCARCESAFIAMIVSAGQGLSSVGMVTDLSFEDAKRLYESDSVALDEIIEAHKVLEKDGLACLLSK
ncbi:MAG: hypothetical protein PHY40_00715 [Patescibacteria group bacterium]|nr:hypothetical protein [Patescibacteria group bacterium]